MKRLGISKLVGSLGLVAILSSQAIASSKLAGIELGSDFKEGCEKVKTLFAERESKKLVFKTYKDRCGFEWGFEWVGLKTQDGSTVDYVGIKNTTFGFAFTAGAQEVTKEYIRRLDAVTHIMDYNSDNQRYEGTNLLGTEKVTISYFVTAISKVVKTSSFDIK